MSTLDQMVEDAFDDQVHRREPALSAAQGNQGDVSQGILRRRRKGGITK